MKTKEPKEIQHITWDEEARFKRFVKFCDALGIPPTRRQLSKYKHKRGRAFTEGPAALKKKEAAQIQEEAELALERSREGVVEL